MGISRYLVLTCFHRPAESHCALSNPVIGRGVALLMLLTSATRQGFLLQAAIDKLPELEFGMVLASFLAQNFPSAQVASRTPNI